jgi:hypothetical protein
MIEKFDMSDLARCNMERHRRIDQRMDFYDPIVIEHWRGGKKIAVYDAVNDITNEGKNTIFGVMFYGQTQIPAANWFLGLISNVGYSALNNTDVMNSHSGWTEFTNYSGGARPAWGPGAPASQQVTNATPVNFNITASGTTKGIFVVSDNTLGGTVGKLWATALWNQGDVPVNNGDLLKATYTVSA